VSLFRNGASAFEWLWIFTLFPFIGGLLGISFYELVFKKVTVSVGVRHSSLIMKDIED